jgi:hypothetical protein
MKACMIWLSISTHGKILHMVTALVDHSGVMLMNDDKWC